MSAAAGGSPAIVLDNGGFTCKIGYADPNKHSTVKIVPNCVAKPKRERRIWIGDQLERVLDFSQMQYRRPIEKGYVVNWDLQCRIWDRLFMKCLPNVNPSKNALLVTEPIFNPPSLRNTMDEVVFEKYGFTAYNRSLTSSLASVVHRNDLGQKWGDPCSIIIDSGFSHTHIIPMWEDKPILPAVRRVNVGGKLLTNLLKQVVSYRAFNMMDEVHLINDVKEKLCYVSMDFNRDLQRAKQARSPIAREFVLPNGSTNFVGQVKDRGSPVHEDEQVLVMNNERFSIPEVLFNPSNVGINQAGVAEAVVQAINACPEAMQGLMYQNILLTGGNTCLHAFAERIAQDVRSLAPAEFPIKVSSVRDPVIAAWRGGSCLASSPQFRQWVVTKAEWFEYGPEICRRKFL